MMDLANQRVLVTGGAIRIGGVIAAAFARAGARVAVHCHRSQQEAEALVKELNQLGSGNLVLSADLVNAEQRSRLIAAAVTGLGGLDILINNASVYRRCPLIDLSEAQLRDDFEINFMVPFLLMTDFARQLGRGSVINLLDQRVRLVERGAGSYALAKKSLRDATEAAALEWAPEIRVNAVAPGLCLPPPGVAAENMPPLLANVPMGRASRTLEVAEACLFLARTESITGQIIYVDGGMHLTAPVRAEKSRSGAA